MPPTPGSARGQPPTATILAAFRDQLTEAGFDPATIRDLVLIACEGEIRNDGLAVAATDNTQRPIPGI